LFTGGFQLQTTETEKVSSTIKNLGIKIISYGFGDASISLLKKKYPVNIFIIKRFLI